ncbi:echinoderm microtubule-associated protein-like 1 [Oncorhynchus clarkii lewisi]|uniref:echinoderm microtubule-associated protein-like 1 n=1 Tax=Oncorhynchus clarkii lewisi TaxID=490388 RepID=UPI0039B9CE16
MLDTTDAEFEASKSSGIHHAGRQTGDILAFVEVVREAELLKPNQTENDNVSAGSTMEVDDRLSHLEQRVQLQEDEIQLLKAALADALRRLGGCEELTQTGAGAGGRRPTVAAPTKVRQLLQALPSKPLTLSNGYVQQKQMGGYPSSPSSPKKEVLQSIKRKSMSTERLSTVRREMVSDSRSRTTSSSSSTCGRSR